MTLLLLKSITRWFQALLAGPATPLVPAAAAPVALPVILECAFVDVPVSINQTPAQAPADQQPAAAPRVDEPDERPVIVAIGAQAAALNATRRLEPEDYMLAQRLRSVAVLNRPRSRVERRPIGTPRRRSAGPLSPIRARARSSDRRAIAA
jgi:hypothetical protein